MQKIKHKPRTTGKFLKRGQHGVTMLPSFGRTIIPHYSSFFIKKDTCNMNSGTVSTKTLLYSAYYLNIQAKLKKLHVE